MNRLILVISLGSFTWENVIFTDTEKSHLVTDWAKSYRIVRKPLELDGTGHTSSEGRAPYVYIHLQPEDGLVSMGK